MHQIILRNGKKIAINSSQLVAPLSEANTSLLKQNYLYATLQNFKEAI